MLTFFGRQRQFCDHVSRRDFLKVGALTVGGLSLADILRAQAAGSSATPGNVIGTDPSAGSRVKSDKPVVLIASSGPQQVPVPNVVGQSQAAATTTLKAAGFVVTATTASSTSTGFASSERGKRGETHSRSTDQTDHRSRFQPCPLSLPIPLAR